MKQIPVIIYGAGGVGQALLHQIMASRDVVAQRNDVHFNVVVVADSRSWLWDSKGLTDEAIHAGISAKRSTAKQLIPNAGKDLQAALDRIETRKTKETITPLGKQRPDNLEILAEAERADLEQVMVVDVTATDGMEPTLHKALDLGYGVVLANKKPLAGTWQTAQAFYHHPHVRHESTVGGGQPVIATMRYLLDTNDPVRRIEGQLSGTLGFICRQMDEGALFSHALLAAKVKGYTEPDPREDLGGKDVMRKILILGRMAGWAMEESNIEVESLYPSALTHLPVQEFMQASVALDPSFQDRVNAAGASGEVLRFVAEIEDGKGSVGLQAVPMESPIANLKYIRFQTGLYDEEPLMIAGKGAGVDMTAAGVLGDMIDLAREM